DVVLRSALGNRGAPRIAAPLEGDPVVYGPSQHRSEQDDPADIAIDNEMRHGPGLHADQHGMFQDTFDIARKIGRGDENAGRQHQRLGDMPRPTRRGPQHDWACCVVDAEALAGDIEADDRDDGEQGLVGPFAQLLHCSGALGAHGHKHVVAEKQDQAENEYQKAHVRYLHRGLTFARSRSEAGHGSKPPDTRGRHRGPAACSRFPSSGAMAGTAQARRRRSKFATASGKAIAETRMTALFTSRSRASMRTNQAPKWSSA